MVCVSVCLSWWDFVCFSSTRGCLSALSTLTTHSLCSSHAGVLANLEPANPLLSLHWKGPLPFLLFPSETSPLRHPHGSRSHFKLLSAQRSAAWGQPRCLPQNSAPSLRRFIVLSLLSEYLSLLLILSVCISQN